MKAIVAHFAADTSGATAIEYAIVAVLISAAALGIIDAAGIKLAAIFARLSAKILG